MRRARKSTKATEAPRKSAAAKSRSNGSKPAARSKADTSPQPKRVDSHAKARPAAPHGATNDRLLERLRAGELTLLVERGGRLAFASDRAGFRPIFRAILEHAELFEGGDVACGAVGLAVAYLFAHAKVGRVSTNIISKDAERALDEAGIPLIADQHVKQLAESDHDDMDQLARDSGTVGRFLDELRQKLA